VSWKEGRIQTIDMSEGESWAGQVEMGEMVEHAIRVRDGEFVRLKQRDGTTVHIPVHQIRYVIFDG